jgi:hypothetical protein
LTFANPAHRQLWRSKAGQAIVAEGLTSERILSEIRACSREDIPAVAALFQRKFRDGDAAPPASLESALATVHFDHPRYDPEIAPRVHVNDAGRVTGFIGVFPGRFVYRGRDLRAAIAGSLMVEDPASEPMAGARLVRSVAKGPQDLSISETSNAVSQGLWRRLGGTIVAPMSLDWFRIFQPGRAALAALAETLPTATMLGPFVGAGDRLARRWASRYLDSPAADAALLPDSHVADEAVAAAILELAAETELRPRWTQDELQWLLRQAATKERFGPLNRGVLRDRNGALAGCYLYHGRAGGIGRVLNLLARPNALDSVVGWLMREAADRGLAALRGRSNPELLGALIGRKCLFAQRGAMTLHSSDRELARVAESGAALITGLAGESWSPLIGHEFR